MKNYRKTSHSVYDLKFHLVWITKYRKPVLFGNVATRLRDLI
ncbi:MAG: transposase, partial [Deltaproteobacteria bacterium]|nr:transposase [Deltaproteobacteria bacterium]MBW1930207.1 transposase [Deltaproteobacteria bacterium]MBW2024270.1 transposase [Deltaproteobacteria bacterium]